MINFNIHTGVLCVSMKHTTYRSHKNELLFYTPKLFVILKGIGKPKISEQLMFIYFVLPDIQAPFYS